MALSLARRYRPRRFSDLLAQDHVAAVLRGAVQQNRVGHGYLLTGPRGVGKTTAARILAMALNCERKGSTESPGEPCGACESCSRIWNGSASLDVVEIDAASNRGVDDARDLRERAMYAASREGHHKIYIVDEAHMLTREAWNALLKILEEPPAGVVFVFATTEPHKIAQTAAPVMSRLQRFDFRRIGPIVIRDRLRQVLAAEGIAAEDDALTLIARQADGGMRDALSVLDQCLSLGEEGVTTARVREILGLVDEDLYGSLLGILAERRAADVFPLMDRLMEAGADLAEFANGAAELLRALLMIRLGSEPPALTEGMRQALMAHQERLAPGDILRMLKLIAENEGAIRRSAHPRIAVETLLLRWAMMDRAVDLAQVLGEGGSGGPTAPSRVPAREPTSRPTSGGSPSRAARAPAPAPAPPPPPPPQARSVEPLAFNLEVLREHWAEIAAQAREQSPFLGEALAGAEPEEATAPRLIVRLPDENPIHAETLQRQARVIEKLIGGRVGGPVTFSVRFGTPPEAGEAPPAPRPKRLSEAEARAQRLQILKGKDPALGAAASELDLEIVE